MSDTSRSVRLKIRCLPAVQDAKFQVEKAGVPKGKQPGIIIKLARKELVDRTFDGSQLAKMVKAL